MGGKPEMSDAAKLKDAADARRAEVKAAREMQAIVDRDWAKWTGDKDQPQSGG